MGKTIRLTNIEMLRLLLMFMILNLHSFHQEPTGSMTFMDWMDCMRESASVPSVTAFVLISGFFSIRWSIKKFFTFLYQVFFFIVIIHLLLVLIKWPVETNFLGGAISVITHVGKAYWFVDVYLVLMLFAPMINDFIDKIPTRKLFKMVLFLFICAWLSVVIGSQQFRGNCPESFLIFYLTGRLLRRWYDEGLLSHLQMPILILSYLLISVVNTILYVFLEIHYKSGYLVFGYETPLVVAQACILFVIFLKIPFSSRTINNIASSAFAIYLLHMHGDLKQWYYEYTTNLYNFSVGEHVLLLLLLFMAVGFIAIVIDKIREYSFNLILRIINK